MDPKDVRGNKHNHNKPRKSTESFSSKGDVFMSLTSFPEFELERGNSSQATDSNASVSDAYKSFSFHSLSSSSSSEIPSEDDLIHVDPKKITLFSSASSFATGSPNDVQTPNNKFLKKKLGVFFRNNNNTGHMDSPPPIQVMERSSPGPPGFDPKRIPESIFNSKSPGPTDWSIASNESLFSIRIGNSSFSREHVVKVPESGETDRSQDVPDSGELGKYSEPSFRDSSVREKEILEEEEYVEMDAKNGEIEEEGERGRESVGEYVRTDTKISEIQEVRAEIASRKAPLEAPDHRKARSTAQELSFKVHANANGSRAKQVSAVKKKKHSYECCCTGCTCEFCCSVKLSCCFCKWPTCDCCELPNCDNCCKFSSCKCCKWPSFGNCCKWPSCGNCCKWPNCENCCSFKCCKWPNCNNCCSFKCCKWPSCDNCCKGCKFPSCGDRGDCNKCCKCGNCSNCCKWPSCGNCSNCCKWPKSCSCSNCCSWPKCCSCSNCCKWPSCKCFSRCCKWPSCNCFSNCCPTGSCKFPSCSCSWPRECCKWSSNSSCSCGRGCRWESVFCCLSKSRSSRRPSRGSRHSCSWFSSIFCCS